MPIIMVTTWTDQEMPSEAAIRHRLKIEGLEALRWSNGPGDVYNAHEHPYAKVIYVLEGALTFSLPQSGEKILLKKGDRLDLPPHTLHDAVVGPYGVVCLEAHRMII